LGYGDQKLLDVISHDGLVDAFNKISMGLCAEKTASDFKITREMQDEYCKGSYRKHMEAAKKGYLADEIVPIRLKEKGKEEEVIAEDEEARRYKEDKIASIPPAFSKTGTITAANASKINDGAISISNESSIQSWPHRKRCRSWA
jgi:acetyl-CoA C-acetyltransferase